MKNQSHPGFPYLFLETLFSGARGPVHQGHLSHLVFQSVLRFVLLQEARLFVVVQHLTVQGGLLLRDDVDIELLVRVERASVVDLVHGLHELGSQGGESQPQVDDFLGAFQGPLSRLGPD